MTGLSLTRGAIVSLPRVHKHLVQGSKPEMLLGGDDWMTKGQRYCFSVLFSGRMWSIVNLF